MPEFFIRNSPNSVVTSSDPVSFRHPESPRERLHGPAGYADYASYRPWLRDEFSYRCVYCLIREQWGRVTGEFDLDHFLPQATDPALAQDYDNLVYSCHRCNLRKADDTIPDPLAALTSQTVRIHFDGTLGGMTPEANGIIRKLFLNSPEMIRWRKMWIRICELAAEYDLKVCFHHHPRPTALWHPDTIWKAIEGRHPNIGFCADVGHWASSALDPLEVIKKVAPRVHAFHLKDRASISEWSRDQPFGTGSLDLFAILDEVRKHGFAGNVTIEYETNWKTNLAEISQCVGYLRAYSKLRG